MVAVALWRLLLTPRCCTSQRSVRAKLKDGFSRFPGFGNGAKVLGFRAKKLTRMVWDEWKLFSDSYIKRLRDEELQAVLREKRRKREVGVVEAQTGGAEMVVEVRRDPGGRSFLVRVDADRSMTLRRSWLGWKRLTILTRERRIENARMRRRRDAELRRAVFEAWADSTHFISRRASSWTGGRGKGREGRGGGRPLPLTDKSMIMMSFLNASAGKGGEGGGGVNALW